MICFFLPLYNKIIEEVLDNFNHNKRKKQETKIDAVKKIISFAEF